MRFRIEDPRIFNSDTPKRRIKKVVALLIPPPVNSQLFINFNILLELISSCHSGLE
jgi:hypothetical protein